MKRRQKQNAVAAMGHFLSWATEFSILIVVNILSFVDIHCDLKLNMVELLGFFYPSVNLVVFPLVQMMSSRVLRSEARKFFEASLELIVSRVAGLEQGLSI